MAHQQAQPAVPGAKRKCRTWNTDTDTLNRHSHTAPATVATTTSIRHRLPDTRRSSDVVSAPGGQMPTGNGTG